MRMTMLCDVVVENRTCVDDPTSTKLSETIYFHPLEGEPWTADASGTFMMTISNPEKWGSFKERAHYAVEITEPAPSGGPAT